MMAARELALGNEMEVSEQAGATKLGLATDLLRLVKNTHQCCQ
jgi:hypothetical protein